MIGLVTVECAFSPNSLKHAEADPYPVQRSVEPIPRWESLHYPVFSSVCLTRTTSLLGGLEWISVFVKLQYSRNDRCEMTSFTCDGWKCHPFGLHKTLPYMNNLLMQGFSHLREAHLQSQWKVEECCQLNVVCCHIIRENSIRCQINTQ